MKKAIVKCAENAELVMLRKTVELQKGHIKRLNQRQDLLESMVKTLMKQQGKKRTEIFVALHTGELPE